jgi:hypothetical protein
MHTPLRVTLYYNLYDRSRVLINYRFSVTAIFSLPTSGLNSFSFVTGVIQGKSREQNYMTRTQMSNGSDLALLTVWNTVFWAAVSCSSIDVLRNVAKFMQQIHDIATQMIVLFNTKLTEHIISR